MGRTISVTEITRKKYKELRFTSAWETFLGIPERSGSWIIWGGSGNGKTSFAMQLAKELAKYGKVAYWSLEEKTRKTMQKAIIRNNMKEVSRRFCLLNDTLQELEERLVKRNAPDIVFIDSYQFLGLAKKEYIDFCDRHPNKLFVWLSHSEGKEPEGRPAKFVKFNSDQKIRVEGYQAFNMSRLAGLSEPYIIWKEGADQYWGVKKQNKK